VRRDSLRFFLAAALLCLLLPAPTAWAAPASLLNGYFQSNFDLLNRRRFPEGGGGAAWGAMNQAALRYKASPNENLSFYVSGIMEADSGYYAREGDSDVTLKLERLYFRVGGDRYDVETGLIRIARGYGYVFSPMDIFNPRDVTNTLDPQSRPEGKWGVHATFYPQDLWKIEAFGLAPEDRFEKGPWGSVLGAATTFSVGKNNFDMVYALEFPEVPCGSDPADSSLPPYTNNDFTHVTGVAFKTDIEIGLYVELVYLWEQPAFFKGYEGLRASCGVDYTFSGMDLYLLAEYLFYGGGHADWGRAGLDSLYTSPDWKRVPPSERAAFLDLTKAPLPFARHDYLFLMGRYTPRQDLGLGASILAGLDDPSALCTLFAEYEAVQGLTLQFSFLQPLDAETFDSSARPGEWGSTSLGFYQALRVGARVRF
jgi:hypothetical protein